MMDILRDECFKKGHKPRDVQVKAIEFLEQHWHSPNICKVLSLPTGSGKSMIARTISKFNEEDNLVTAIITPQNLLIDQYKDEFTDLNSFKGKVNYKCDMTKTNCLEGEQVQKLVKKFCKECPYQIAKKRCYEDYASLFNPLSYLGLPKLGDGPRGIEILYNVDTIIIDEFQSLSAMIRDLSTIKLWSHDIKWKEGISQDIKRVSKLLRSYVEKISEFIVNPGFDKKEKIQLLMTQKKVEYIIYQMLENEKYFLCEEAEEPFRGVPTKCILIRPKYIPPCVYKNFFKIANRVILMSGTAFPFMWEELGFDKVDYIDLPSPIPKERRSVFVMNSIRLSSNDDNRVKTMEDMATSIKQIVNKFHPGENGVILLPYNLAEEIRYYLDEPWYVHMCKTTKKSKIEDFKESKTYSVGVFSGSYEGLNLSGNISRFTIIPKVPFPNLMDRVVKIRQEENPINYGLETMTTIIQAAGRSTRSEEDYSYTYILDGNFPRLYATTRKYIPNYFKESLIFSVPDETHFQQLNNFRGSYEITGITRG